MALPSTLVQYEKDQGLLHAGIDQEGSSSLMLKISGAEMQRPARGTRRAGTCWAGAASDFAGPRHARGASQSRRTGGALCERRATRDRLGSGTRLYRTREETAGGRRLDPQPNPGAVAAVSFSQPAGDHSTPAGAETSTRLPGVSAQAPRGPHSPCPHPAPSSPALSVWSAGARAAVSLSAAAQSV